MYTELENDNSCDFDDGGGEEPMIQELDLDAVVNQVQPELLEQQRPTPPESASPTDPASTLQEETAETIFAYAAILVNSLITENNIIG
jgi:hypothetical protein